MIGHQPPQSSRDKIVKLLNGFDEQWFKKLRKEINQFRYVDEEEGVFEIAIFENNSSDDSYSDGIQYCYFEWYSWSGTPNNAIIEESFKEYAPKGHEVFDKVVSYIKDIHVNYISPDMRVDVVEDILDQCEMIFGAKETSTADKHFKSVLKAIRREGVAFIRMKFKDLLSHHEYSKPEKPLYFNLNQNHLAYLLAVLLKGGIIENSKEEVVEFANQHFLCKKENKKQEVEGGYSQLSSFINKVSAFYNNNGSVSSRQARKKVMEKFSKGQDAILI